MLIWVSRTLSGSHESAPGRHTITGSVIGWGPRCWAWVSISSFFPWPCFPQAAPDQWLRGTKASLLLAKFPHRLPGALSTLSYIAHSPTLLLCLLHLEVRLTMWSDGTPRLPQPPPAFLSHRHFPEEIPCISQMNCILISSPKKT